ncbi:MAG: DNA-directed RNA polymerase subunit omega [Treponema sp.]|nr:MAG: DNA-directed RNA polymerase subunit omega [Treponema sp.]
MTFPLRNLIEFEGNIYEITCASTRRAGQIAALQTSIDEHSNTKAVPEAARQIFTGDVAYEIEYQQDHN